MKTILIAAAIAASTALGAQAAPNLVANGSFEAGLAGWTIGGTDAGFDPAAIFYGAAQPYPQGAFGEAVPADNSASASPDAPGERAAYFVDDFATNQSLSQQVFLNAGDYEIGFSAYAPANGFANAGDARFSGTVAGITLANYLVSTGPVTTWQAFSGNATVAVSGLYTVSFTFNTNLNPSKDVVIDRVYIVASDDGGTVIPEPAGVALLGLGVGLAGFAARRRKAA